MKKLISKVENSFINQKNAKNFCNHCNQPVVKFIPWGEDPSEHVKKFDIIGSKVETMGCPHCDAHDRVRHLLMYNEKLNLWNTYIANKVVLHMAPERSLMKIFSKLHPKEYICGDMFPSSKEINKIDLTQIPFQDEYFDFVMCNHVLEHVPDDIKAMKEIFRVLKVGGSAILQTPYAKNIEKSYEDSSINTDQKRLEHFGQSDHVRIYGQDYFSRLQDAGFTLCIVKNDQLFTEDECDLYGVNYREDLLFVSK